MIVRKLLPWRQSEWLICTLLTHHQEQLGTRYLPEVGGGCESYHENIQVQMHNKMCFLVHVFHRILCKKKKRKCERRLFRVMISQIICYCRLAPARPAWLGHAGTRDDWDGEIARGREGNVINWMLRNKIIHPHASKYHPKQNETFIASRALRDRIAMLCVVHSYSLDASLKLREVKSTARSPSILNACHTWIIRAPALEGIGFHSASYTINSTQPHCKA